MDLSPLLDLHRAANASTVDIDETTVADRYPGALEAPLTADDTMCVDLSHLPNFRLVGDDVRRWTNGMFTNNTRRLQPGEGNRHCACDDRGRVRGVLDLYLMAEDTVRIVLDGMTAEAFHSRYRMYLLLDDIEVEEDEPAHALITVQGAAAVVLTTLGLPTPDASHAHTMGTGARDGIWVARRDRSGRGGFDIVVPADQAPALWRELVAAGARAGGVGDLDDLRIQAGRAAFPADATDKSMVHELRLNVECCAFDKGCYVGQEVINRIDVKGAIQKRITRVVLEAAVPKGSEVWLADRKVGLLSSRASVDGRELGLGVLRKTAWADGTEVRVAVGDDQWVRGVVLEPAAASA